MDYRKITSELKKELVNQLGENIEDVVLFGSSLDDTKKACSDVDILIILNEDYDYRLKRKINDICYNLDLKYDIFIDSQLISINELKHGLRGKHPFVINAIQNGYHA